MAEIDKDLQKAIDDHLKRLYERYKSNTKVFTAAVVGHISLSTVFVISILIPFLFLQIDARETNSELERLSQGIAQPGAAGRRLPPGHDGSQEAYEAVENTPNRLEGYIQALEKEAAGGPAAPCRMASSQRRNPAVRLPTKTVGWNAASDSTWLHGLLSPRRFWRVKLELHSRGSTSRSSISGRRTFKPECNGIRMIQDRDDG